MLPQFTITIIKSGIHSKEDLLQIEQSFKTKEILGQIIDPNKKSSLELNPDRISHSIKNIRYNSLTDSLVGDIEILPTVYGIQLAKIYETNIDSLSFTPVYSNLRFVRVDIGINQND